MKKFEKYERRGLPGGPNEITSYMTGAISTQGYKSNSPDKYNDFNIITSGNITMEDVDFPVFGMDNLGNMAAMMPGANYKFPGDMVFEMPMAQRGNGETVDGIPMLNPNAPISSQTNVYTVPSQSDNIAFQDAMNQANAERAGIRASIELSDRLNKEAQALGFNNYEEYSIAKARENTTGVDNTFTTQASDLGMYNDIYLPEITIQSDPGKPTFLGSEALGSLFPMGGSELIPGVGDGMDAIGFADAVKKGNYLDALIYAGAFALPFIGGAGLRQLFRRGAKQSGKATNNAIESEVRSLELANNPSIAKELAEPKPVKNDWTIEEILELPDDEVKKLTGREKWVVEKLYEKGDAESILRIPNNAWTPTNAFVAKVDAARKRLISYYRSSAYKERLINGLGISYDEADDIIERMVKQVEDTDVKYNNYGTRSDKIIKRDDFTDAWAGRAMKDGNPVDEIYLGEHLLEYDNVTLDDVLQHEFGHASTREVTDFGKMPIEEQFPDLDLREGMTYRPDYYSMPVEARERGMSVLRYLDDNNLSIDDFAKMDLRDLADAPYGVRQFKDVYEPTQQADYLKNIFSVAPIIGIGTVGAATLPDEMDTRQRGGGIEVPKREGVRENSDGTVSTHIMRTEFLPDEGWVVFPSLFQNQDGSWVDMSQGSMENWMPVYEEALKRNEVIYFGDDKEGAINFGEGSWKKQKGGEETSIMMRPSQPITQEDVPLAHTFNLSSLQQPRAFNPFSGTVGAFNIPAEVGRPTMFGTYGDVAYNPEGIFRFGVSGDAVLDRTVKPKDVQFLRSIGVNIPGPVGGSISPYVQFDGPMNTAIKGSMRFPVGGAGLPGTQGAPSFGLSLTKRFESGGELEQRAMAMGESPEYARAVQRMIDNGATIQELASRRIGTVSGLSQLFPDAEMGSVSQRSSSSGNAATSEIEDRASEFGMTPEDYNRYYNRGLRFISEGKTIDDLVNMRYGTRSGLTRMFPDAPISSSATYSPSPENKPSPMPQQTPAQVSSVPTEIPAQPAMIVPDPIIERTKDVDAGLAADAQMAREQMYTTPASEPIYVRRKGVRGNDADEGLTADATNPSTQPNVILETYLPDVTIYGEKEEPLRYNSINIPSLSGQFNFSSGLSKFLPIPAASTEPYFTVPEGTFRGPSTIEEIRQQNAAIQERGKAILQDKYVSSGVNKYTNIPFDEYPLYLAEDMEGYDQVINAAEQKISESNRDDSPYADDVTETEINRRLAYDVPRYGEFMSNPNAANRTGNLRQNDANIFFADVAKPNSVIIDIGAGLGNSDPREAGISTYELFKNPKIQENNITVIASDIAPEAKKFIGRENNPHGDMEAYSIPINEEDYGDINNFLTPITDILKDKGVSDVEDIYLRATNGIDIIADEDITEKHFEHIGNTLKDKNVTYVYNNMILYKPKGEKQFTKIGNVANTGMDHRNPSWIGKDFDPTRISHYLLNDDLFGDGYVPRRQFGGGIDDDGKIKYVAETDQGGYRVGVDVDRGDRQRSKSFSLEPSGDTSYSRSVTTPKGSRSKSIDIVDGEATKTITRTRNGETTERTKTLSDRKADRLSKRYARKVNRVFTDPFPEVPNPNEGKFTIEYEQGGEAATPDFGSYGLNIEDTLLFPRYINYMNGNDESIEARRVYDKLNRKVYRYAKQGGMTAPDYIMTEVLRLGGSV